MPHAPLFARRSVAAQFNALSKWEWAKVGPVQVGMGLSGNAS